MSLETLSESTAAQALRDRFCAQGAVAIEPGILMPADTLIDLYGEDIRARAYTSHDPARGELMLRPDFTVAVTQAHLASGQTKARYAYAGPVFRQQEDDPNRPSEYLQVGLEYFGGDDLEAEDAALFAAVSAAMSPLALRASIGDIGLLTAAIEGLSTTPVRKAALRRHLWRPRRFRTMLERFAGRKAAPAGRARLLDRIAAGSDPFAEAGPQIGLRTKEEIEARIERLQADAVEPPIPEREVVLLEQLFNLREVAQTAAEQLSDIAVDLPSIQPAVSRFTTRLAALEDLGIDISRLDFEASYGRTTLEYYDGFVFGLSAPSRPDLPTVVTGGRYDALTRVLGNGRACPAIGAAIRMHVAFELANEMRLPWP